VGLQGEYRVRRQPHQRHRGAGEENADSLAKKPLCLTGHLDVVSLGTRKWRRPVIGRDRRRQALRPWQLGHESGVAAILIAARTMAKKLSGTPGVVIVLTAAEEGGCIGSKKPPSPSCLGKAGAIVVGEPTRLPSSAGATRARSSFNASFRRPSRARLMPHLGDNAV